MSGLRTWLRTDFARLFSDSALVFAVRLAAAVITYATQVLLANWMGAEQLGILVFAMACLWILNVLSTLGLGSAAYRFIPHYQSTGELALATGFVRWSRRVVSASGLALGALGVGGIWLLARASGDAQHSPLLLAFAVLPFIALTTLQGGIARAFLWFSFASLTGTLLRPLLLLAAVLCAWWLDVAPSALRVMQMLAAILIIVWLIQTLGLRRRLSVALAGASGSDKRARLWVRVALPIVMAELFVGYFTDVNVIIAGAFLDPAQIAVYNAALRTVAIIAFGITAVGSVVAPRAARLYSTGDIPALQRLIASATHLMFWPSVLALAFLAVFGRSVLGLFGPEFVAGYTALLIAGLAQVLISLAGPLLPLLNVAGHQDRCVAVFGAALLATPLMYAMLMPWLGLTGGALALLLVSAGWSAWLYRLVVRYVGIRPSLLSLWRRPA